jgi:cell fate (sporulation/competence/biofilm development) regulator YmcA (YheA/YmcA/DUF963 family)
VKKLSNALSILIDELLVTDEVLEFQKLEKLVLNNKEIAEILEHLHNIEKQAVNAKELGLENAYLMYKKEYDEIISKFENDVLISSYLNAKEDVLRIINLVTSIIENEINKVVNE